MIEFLDFGAALLEKNRMGNSHIPSIGEHLQVDSRRSVKKYKEVSDSLPRYLRPITA